MAFDSSSSWQTQSLLVPLVSDRRKYTCLRISGTYIRRKCEQLGKCRREAAETVLADQVQQSGRQACSAAMGHQCTAEVIRVPNDLTQTFFFRWLVRKFFRFRSRDLNIEIKDFGPSWRDGIAFLGVIEAIRSGLIDIEALRRETNKVRLETAFDVAESELGVARLLGKYCVAPLSVRVRL